MMVVLLFAAAAVIVVLALLNVKVDALKQENRQLKQQVEQLWRFIRERGQQEYVSSEKDTPPAVVNPASSPDQPASPQPVPVWMPAAPAVIYPAPPAAQPASPQPVSVWMPAPPAAVNPVPPAAQPVPIQPVPVWTPAASAAASPVRPAAQPASPQSVPAWISASQPVHPASVAATKKEGTPGRMENWFGRNVLGIAASILFFIGLIVFAVWIYKDISNVVKVILMYAISTGITTAGILLARRRRNTFTLILSGCGSGLLFISILLTHVHFGYFNDIVTFGLLLLWLIAALVLSKLLNSTLISIVAHTGMGISICFAYAAGLKDDKLVMLLVYQATSIAVILLGNILCCRKTYRFGLFLSVAVTLAAGAFMASRFIGGLPLSEGAFPRTGLPDWGVASSFFAQFLCVSFLSYLLAVSTTRLESAAARMGIHIASKTLWAAAFYQNVLMVVFRLGYAGAAGSSSARVTAAWIMAAVGMGILLLNALLSLFMSTKLNFDRRLTTLTVILSGCLCAVLLFVVWQYSMSCLAEPRLPWLIVPAVLLLLTGIRWKNNACTIAADVLLGVEWFLMSIWGFHELTRFGTVALPLLYMVLYAALLWGQWAFRPGKTRAKQFAGMRIFTYFFLQGTVFIIMLGSGYRYWGVSLLLALTVFNVLLCLFRYDRGENPAPAYCMRTVEVLLLSVNAATVAFVSPRDVTEEVLYGILAVFTAIYAFCRLPLTLGRGNMAQDIYTGIKFTVLTLAFLKGFTPWFAWSYVLTLVTMGTFLFSLIVGYWRKVQGLVHYALIAATLWTLKLLYDFSSSDSLSFLISIFGTSLVLFGMQVLYEKLDADKRYAYSSALRAVQHVMLAVSALLIAFVPYQGTAETVVSVLLAVLSMAWAFWRTPKSLGRSTRQEDVLEGIKLTVLVLAVVQGYTDWFASAYVLSLICMLTALTCIIAGFVRHTGGLRLYGLVLTMVCVLKLVTWDVAGLETLLRILSMVGGGVICFVISAIYSYSVKRLSISAKDARETEGDPEEPSTE